MMNNKSISLSQRMDTAKESPLFYNIFMLVGAGLLLDSSDVYMASNVNSSMIATKFATLSQGSAFLSAGFLGLFLGSIIAGYLGDFYGRSKTFQWNLLIFGIATLIAAFAPNIYFLIAMRFIAAIGLGAEVVTGFSMINEFAPVQNRGKWSGTISVFANLGAPFGFLLSTLLITNTGWRSMFLVLGFLAIILWFARRHLPESPRWLMIHGQEEQAQMIIEKLETIGHYDAQNISKEAKPMVSRKRGLMIAIIAISATLLCQYMFTSWVPTLLLGKGLNIIHSMWFSTIMMIGAPFGAFIGMLLVDRIGRKKTIVPSFILIAIAGIAYAFETTSNGILINGFILTALMYVSMASTISVYAPELFSTDFRFRGTGYANGIAKLLITISPYLVLFTVSAFGQTTLFIMIAAIAIIAAIIIAIFGPETKNQRIE
ncbi:MFS transporter (plasmid) [Nicoliella spurrieriana]|uniref:MFS transporter n=1 Tax=Nicoliella spurrieriana TaxID=2925830 RepID=A0A976X4H4_9LACO|nr:MFS transporter [Nicoliella spurrieriana]UQS85948.1 MFS transporter [Nicoliella spurrieriana]